MSDSLVAVSTYGRGGASSRVRLYDWCDHLGLAPEVYDYGGHANNSLSTLARDPLGVARSELALRRVRAERLFLCRQASPFSRGSLEQLLLKRAGHGVYDFDDALFADERSSLAGMFDKPLKTRRAVQAADVVIAGNDYLADWASQHSNNVVVIPSCVEPDRYQPKASWELADRPLIVWIGSPSTEKFLQVSAAGVLAAAKQHGARLAVISAGDGDLGPLNDVVDRLPWSAESFAALLSTADVAIAPLVDDPFTRGKCAYKLLQYAATGLPMIGSPVGANALALKRFEGIAAVTDAEWVSGLDALLGESSAERMRRGTAAIAAVRVHYSFASWVEEWRRAVSV